MSNEKQPFTKTVTAVAAAIVVALGSVGVGVNEQVEKNTRNFSSEIDTLKVGVENNKKEIKRVDEISDYQDKRFEAWLYAIDDDVRELTKETYRNSSKNNKN